MLEKTWFAKEQITSFVILRGNRIYTIDNQISYLFDIHAHKRIFHRISRLDIIGKDSLDKYLFVHSPFIMAPYSRSQKINNDERCSYVKAYSKVRSSS